MLRLIVVSSVSTIVGYIAIKIGTWLLVKFFGTDKTDASKSLWYGISIGWIVFETHLLGIW
ncbi:hypothetical protein [Sulfoacidibacillus thermotolerans]|uniref:Uncharacterized protein n=1 Tax=Sulfoacidibacillus thermotolerans TaxID=1765684 RepID=A0A2U3D6D5_SULT2|nr:hypothetical protein [Sulfoacidibacillus thermotolerans]PWI56835.1 hypothetical protein BM613_11840 [Sulfoacidibacillus thermotolerans]PWI58260.1 hypothetical protein BM613_04920 [Sulfoacidibacillus thermotolerans]